MKIILTRHGESEANKQGIIQGQAIDSPLSKNGKKQAKALAKRLKNKKISAIYSSDLKRAMETANEIAKIHSLKIIPDKRLREFDAGYLTKRGTDYLLNERDKIAKQKKISPREVKFPGGESEIDHYNRISDFIKSILKKHTENDSIIVVAHSGTNKNILGVIKHTPLEKIYSVGQANTCVNEIEYQNGKWIVHKLSCIKHLEGNKKLIEAFEKIRGEPLDVINNRCWEKHKKLKKLFEELGFKTRYDICSFKWSEQKLPPEILKLPHENLDYHPYLNIRIYGKWMIVDASIDPRLPGYNIWDGLSDCNLGVKPTEIFMFKKSDELVEKLKENKETLKTNRNFLEEVNKFLEGLRKK